MKRPTRSSPLSFVAIVMFLLSIAVSATAAPLPGGTLDPLTIPKYVTPLVIPPVMNVNGAADNYAIAVRQFKQQILPGGIWNTLSGRTDAFPATTVWSYGPDADPPPDSLALGGGAGIAPAPNSQFNYPAYTIETNANTAVNVRWINGLVDNTNNFLPHLLPVDQTVMWANPTNAGCRMGNPNRTDCATDNAAPYTGPVPMVVHVHGAHVDPHSDGYAFAWWLPAASNIPAGYAMSGSFFDDSTGTNPGNLGYADFRYRNDQPAATIWYHDHAMGMTRNNVYAGPAGFWLIRGGVYDGGLDNTGAAAVLPGPAPVAGQAVLDLNTNTAIRNAIREIPIAIQDRSFNADGSLFYPSSRSFFDGFNGPYTGSTPISTDIAPIANVEAFFNTMVVNGSTWPELKVAPALYRFRLLNGCNSRFLNLSLRNMTDNTERPFYQIGAEQGFLPNVVMVTTGFSTPLPGNGTIPAPVANTNSADQALLMGNAERADVIVDFRNLPNGTVVRMINTGADEPFGGFPVGLLADDNTTGQVMQFVVDNTLLVAADSTTTPPENLVLNHEPAIGAATVTRQVSLNEDESTQVCVYVDILGTITGVANVFQSPLPAGKLVEACASIGAVPMGPKSPQLGLVDLSNPAAPAGIILPFEDESGTSKPVPVTMADGVTIKTVNVTENPTIVGGVAPIEEWEIYNFTMDAHPIHLHLVDFQVVGRSLIAGGASPIGVQPTEAGFKDTVVAYPGEITRVRARFDIEGLYVWHCHIVEHEDNEMMRPFVVSAAATAPVATVAIAASPAGSAPKGTSIVFTATGVGGPGPIEYKFLARKEGQTTFAVARNFSTVNTWTWNTTNLAATGRYEFQAYARTQGSAAAFEAVSPVMSYTVIDAASPVTVALAAAPIDNAARGTVVQFTATPTGGTGPYEYQFMARRPGQQSFVVAQKYGAANTWNWNTAGVRFGLYEFQVYARRVGAKDLFEAISPSLTYTIYDNTVATAATLTASPVDNAYKGQQVVFTAAATGGTGPYEYQFWARAAGSATWIRARGYNAIDNWTWNTASVKLGNYEFKAHARRQGSTVEAISPILPYTVLANAASAVTLGVDNTIVTRGTPFLFTANATGGSGPYEYQFWARKAGTVTWVRAQGYSASATWSWNTATLLGNYEVQVYARRQGSTAAFEAVSTPVLTVTVQ